MIDFELFELFLLLLSFVGLDCSNFALCFDLFVDDPSKPLFSSQISMLKNQSNHQFLDGLFHIFGDANDIVMMNEF